MITSDLVNVLFKFLFSLSSLFHFDSLNLAYDLPHQSQMFPQGHKVSLKLILPTTISLSYSCPTY